MTAENPLVGLSGRLALLHRLGEMMAMKPQFFGGAGLQAERVAPTGSSAPAAPGAPGAGAGPARLGHLVDYLQGRSEGQILPASEVLRAVLQGLGEIWPGRMALAGVNLGDVWRHSRLPTDDDWGQLVPFHKLSQWLTYSLLEPLEGLGLQITQLDRLTGLAEYRNGGLLLDLGLLVLRDPQAAQVTHLPSSELIVEWRALTVALLDRVADAVRDRVGLNAVELPLVKILQGGTWTAGRQIAAELRPGGGPPLRLDSDGTVF